MALSASQGLTQILRFLRFFSANVIDAYMTNNAAALSTSAMFTSRLNDSITVLPFMLKLVIFLMNILVDVRKK